MKNLLKKWAVTTSILFLFPVICSASGTPKGFWKGYGEELKAYVNGEGLVDYPALKADRQKLDQFIDGVGKVDPKDFETWTRNEKIAFYLNAYNAITLQTIIDHYPITKGGFFSGGKPGGIRDIPGAWDGIKHAVMGEPMVLNHIEHDILRKQFHEPRIHFALVCASIGCPYLRTEPYEAGRLDEQLDDQARRFMANSSKFRIDAANHKVYFSPIFKWFGGDFEPGYLAGSPFKDHSDKDSADLNFISRYLSAQDKAVFLNGKLDVEYLDYDWSLNNQPNK